MSKKQLYALIKWIEDETYTPGVPIEWIKFFNYDSFLSGNYDSTRSVPIEWRNTRKEPHGGWPCYDGLIIQVSEKRSKLEKKFRILQGTKSPKCIIDKNIENRFLKKKKDKRQNEINKQNMMLESNNFSFTPIQKNLSNDNMLEEIAINDTNENIKKKNKSSESIRRFTKKSINYEVPSTSGLEKITEKTTPVYNKMVFKEKVPRQIMFNSSDSEKENLNMDSVNIATSSKVNKVTLETLHEDNLKIQAMIQQLFSIVSKTKTLTELNDKSALFEEEMMEIEPGSGVKIRNRDWKLALSRPTFTAMGLTLLTILFPYEVLLHSNLKGGPSKINRTDGNKAVFTALNPRVLGALMYAVEKQHPSTFKESLLGAAINNKLNVLRRNAQARTAKTPEQEEEEEEEEEM